MAACTCVCCDSSWRPAVHTMLAGVWAVGTLQPDWHSTAINGVPRPLLCCRCATANSACISHDSCCPGASTLCEKSLASSAQGTCKNVRGKRRLVGGRCAAGVMLLSSCVCITEALCCSSWCSCAVACRGLNVAAHLFQLSDSLIPCCHTCAGVQCIARGRYGCSASSNCCGGNRCQRPDATSQGTCQQVGGQFGSVAGLVSAGAPS